MEQILTRWLLVGHEILKWLNCEITQSLARDRGCNYVDMLVTLFLELEWC